ncbi:hypothetical protein M6B38_243480 [Iris pallida]|uniref:Uncharacterized protein n=1 Tax=Iris pallida TaxID=29817 RepID=A0AAX6DIM9_IRIPA|nr:hypothetical protein M6B38_243480 [Iris pallida]
MYRCESVRELHCPEQCIKLNRCEELYCPKEIHRVESIRSAILPRRISVLSRFKDSKKSNRPRHKSESMQVLILVGFMCRLSIYAEILEVDILPYSETGLRNQSSPCDGLRHWHGKPSRTHNSMKQEVLKWLSQESTWPCNEVIKSSRIGSTK